MQINLLSKHYRLKSINMKGLRAKTTHIIETPVNDIDLY